MSCYPELTLSIFVDRELPPDEEAQVASHLETCADCRTLVAQLEGECSALRTVLEEEARELAPTTAMARKNAPLWPWAVLGAATTPLLAKATLASLPSLPPSLGWINDLTLTGGLAALLRGVGHAFTGGEQMLTPIFSFAATVAFAILLLSSVPARRHLAEVARRGGAVLLALGILTTTAQAIEHRESEERLVIAAGEVIPGSLLLTAAFAVVEGDVDGDVFAFARNVTVKGHIKGNLYTGAETVEVTGHIDGSLHAAAQALTLNGAVDGGAYLMGQTITVGADASVGRDLALACELAEVAGKVGRSIHFAAGHLYLKGAVAGDLHGTTEQVVLGPDSSVGGDLRVQVPTEDAVDMKPGATIAGEKKIDLEPWEEQESRSMLTGGFYIGLIIKILGSLIIGLLVVLLAPGAVPRLPAGSTAVLKTMGVGFLALVATPVAILLSAVTVIGIPLAMVTAAIYALTIFLSSLVVAFMLVRALLAPEPGQTGRLIGGTAVALCLILVVTEVPFVGAGLGFLVVILGMGSLVLHAIRLVKGQQSPA